MKLAVGKFFDYRPAAQWAFEVVFSDTLLVSRKSGTSASYALAPTNTFSEEDLDRLSKSVVSITQPKYDITPETASYGNFDFVVPIYDANNIRLKITFEDTDDCLISGKLISSMMGNSVKSMPAWLNVHETMIICINEYNPYNNDTERAHPVFFNRNTTNFNTTASKTYFCKMIEYDEPVYARTSETVAATTVSVTFLAVPIDISFNDNSVVEYTEAEQLSAMATLEESINTLKSIKMHIQASASMAGGRLFGLSFGSANSQIAYDEIYNGKYLSKEGSTDLVYLNGRDVNVNTNFGGGLTIDLARSFMNGRTMTVYNVKNPSQTFTGTVDEVNAFIKQNANSAQSSASQWRLDSNTAAYLSNYSAVRYSSLTIDKVSPQLAGLMSDQLKAGLVHIEYANGGAGTSVVKWINAHSDEVTTDLHANGGVFSQTMAERISKETAFSGSYNGSKATGERWGYLTGDRSRVWQKSTNSNIR